MVFKVADRQASMGRIAKAKSSAPASAPAVQPTKTPDKAPEINAEVIPAPTPVPTAVVVSKPVTAPQVSRPQGTKYDWMAAAGIPQSDWEYVDYIVTHESGWRPNAVNSSSGACGLMQFLPCSIEKAGANWSDPINALVRGHAYAIRRYGSWYGGYKFWISAHWW
ncbi:MAG TPA: transglycosylase SLT domain-containing protein [Caldilineaceae bacterium]|nr:transglycosylase SLT domain-containing protein [Caldilineaceae bacterium]